MAMFTKKRKSILTLAFSRATGRVVSRKSRGTRRGSRGHIFKGRFQFHDVDEERHPRLIRRKMLRAKDSAPPVKPLSVWMRVVTDYGRTVMMDPDQFDAANMPGVRDATPHFG